jgi:hypothetical protein
VICRTELPNPIPSVFAIGEKNFFYLCVKRSRWLEMRDQPKMSNWTSYRAMIVEPQDCLVDPPLPTIEEMQEQSARTDIGFDQALWTAERSK